MDSRGGPPILGGGPPLGTISMDQTVCKFLSSVIAFMVNYNLWEVCASQSADFIVFITPSLFSLVITDGKSFYIVISQCNAEQ